MDNEVKIKSLGKAMKVLECFSTQQPELGITEIANMLGLQKSTVHNIISSFEELGYVTQNSENGKYQLGIKLLRFGYIINNHFGYRNFFLPYMREIANRVDEIVYLAIPHESQVLYIESCCPIKSISIGRNILGERAPMYCTGLGKAMLAYTPGLLDKVISEAHFTRFTENTLVDPEKLRKDIVFTRERGYSIDNMEHEYGIRCIGFPIFGQDGSVIAAVSVSAPSPRLDSDVIKRDAEVIRELIQPTQYKL